MPGEQGTGIEEADGVRALEHDVGRPLTGDDLAEDAVGVVHSRRVGQSKLIGQLKLKSQCRLKHHGGELRVLLGAASGQ